MNALWAVLLTGSALAAWAVMTSVIPRCRAAIYRSGLWSLRDQIVDDVLDNRLGHREDVDALVGGIRMRIKYAPDLSPFTLLPIKFGSRKRLEQDRSESFDPDAPGGEVLSGYYAELDRLDQRYLASASPSGWFLFLVMTAYGALRRLVAAIGFNVTPGKNKDFLGAGSLRKPVRYPNQLFAGRRHSRTGLARR